MPELPELEVVRDVLQHRVIGTTIDAVQLLPPGAPIVVRDLTNLGLSDALTGVTIANVVRRGKFLIFTLNPSSGDSFYLVINPKLSGRLQLAQVGEKRMAKTHIVFSLANGSELRYIDQKVMGQVYLERDPAEILDVKQMGPEPFDISLADFRARLQKFRGEIKGILTRGDFVAGIGNAYADEILWAAKIHPYRKKTQLTPEEIERLYRAMQSTLRQAIDHIQAQIGESIHLEQRDFMAVHMKTGEPCPRCGTPISLVGANQRITNFCRTCQPGGLIKGM
ncbi:MAG: Fpg/Nei family DNA glycosylase [Chloroflexi bacterium]|nr:Fpg/Nei family DNA glycosylase [Chloroflexota bacterium]